MRNGLAVLLVAAAIAVSVAALLLDWEPGPRLGTLGTPMQDGRAALATDPKRPLHTPEQR